MLDRLKEEGHHALRKEFCGWLTRVWNGLPGLPSGARVKSIEVFIVQRPIDLAFDLEEPVPDNSPVGEATPPSPDSEGTAAAREASRSTDERPTRADRRPFRKRLLWTWCSDSPDEVRVKRKSGNAKPPVV